MGPKTAAQDKQHKTHGEAFLNVAEEEEREDVIEARKRLDTEISALRAVYAPKEEEREAEE